MAAARSFTDMFGGASGNVDYGMPTGRTAASLPVPSPADTLEVVARKMHALANVVDQGRSLAVATGYHAAAHAERDPVLLAKRSMTPQEIEQYEAYASGVSMPTFNFTTNRKSTNASGENLRRMQHRAAAMNAIWGVTSATAENVNWVYSNMVYVLPLIIAVTKVEAAQRELLGGSTDLSEMELAEIQTAHKIVGIAMENMNNVFAELRKLSASINHSKDIIQAREHAIKAKISGYKPRQDPVNKHRDVIGKPRIGADFDYASLTGGRRTGRTDLLGGTGLAGTAPSNTRGNRQAAKRARTAEPEDVADEDMAE